MTSLILAETANSVWSYVLIGVVVLLLIAMPIMMNLRNKRETQKVQEQTNSLKVGDKVLTTSGVYGTITEVKFDENKKTVVIETGGKTKSYLTVDAFAIYTVFKSEAELAREQAQREAEEKARLEAEEAKKAEKKAKKDKPLEEQVVKVTEKEEKAPVQEEKAPAKKQTKNKTEKK